MSMDLGARSDRGASGMHMGVILPLYTEVQISVSRRRLSFAVKLRGELCDAHFGPEVRKMDEMTSHQARSYDYRPLF
jgi:hypothetical protein